MEIKSKEIVNGMTCYTVSCLNNLVGYKKILEVLDNILDYQDKEGNMDVESMKEDLLEYREHIVKLNDPHSPIGMSCTCNGYYFKKGSCKHIKFVLDKIKEENENRKDNNMHSM